MYCVKYCDTSFGSGSNPRGGVFVKIYFPSDSDDAKALGMESNSFWEVYSRKTDYLSDGTPVDGGTNPDWDKLDNYIEKKYGTSILQWARENMVDYPYWWQYNLFRARVDKGELDPDKETWVVDIHYKYWGIRGGTTVFIQLSLSDNKWKKEAEEITLQNPQWFVGSQFLDKTKNLQVKAIKRQKLIPLEKWIEMKTEI